MIGNSQIFTIGSINGLACTAACKDSGWIWQTNYACSNVLFEPSYWHSGVNMELDISDFGVIFGGMSCVQMANNLRTH